MRHTRAIWVATGFSVALHVLPLITWCLLGAVPPRTAAQPLSLRLVARPVPSAPTPSTATAEAIQSPRSANAEAQAVPEPAAGTASEAQPLLSKPEFYYPPESVDIRLAPLSDWVLHSKELAPRQIVTLQLKLYVGADGRLDRYDLLVSTLGQAETASLLRDISATSFAAARRKGQPVPSFREVEITVDNGMPYGLQRPPIFQK